MPMWFRKFLVPYKQVIKFIFPNAAFVVKSMSESLTNAMYLNETEICFSSIPHSLSSIFRKSIDFLGRWIVNLFLPSLDVCEDEFGDEFCYPLCYLPYSYQPYFKVQSRSLGFHAKICTDHHYAVLRLGCSR